jgi:hypothetical protein
MAFDIVLRGARIAANAPLLDIGIKGGLIASVEANLRESLRVERKFLAWSGMD